MYAPHTRVALPQYKMRVRSLFLACALRVHAKWLIVLAMRVHFEVLRRRPAAKRALMCVCVFVHK